MRLDQRGGPPAGRVSLSFLLLAGLAFLAYLIWPAPGAFLQGLPLGPLSLALVCGVFPLYCLLPGGFLLPRGSLALAFALCLGKLVLSLLLVQHGLVARYQSTLDGAADPVADVRLDTRFDLHDHDFPLHFFNDATRYDFHRPGEPRRDLLPFSVRWDGWLNIRRVGRHTFYLSSFTAASLALDGHTVLLKPPTGGEEQVTAELYLSPGMHPLALTYEAPYGAPRRLSAGMLRHGRQTPFSPERLSPRPYTRAQRLCSRIARVLLCALDLIYLVLVLRPLAAFLRTRPRSQTDPPLFSRLALRPHHALLLLLGCTAAAAGQILFRDLRGRCLSLSGGDDWFTYESFARDILRHGPLMLLGATSGHAAPFHYQPLYPYFLALCHVLFGEDLAGILGLQVASLVFVGILLYLTSEALWGKKEAAFTLLLWLASLPLSSEYIVLSVRLLSENLAFFLFPLSALLFIRLFQRPDPSIALSLAAGGTFGLTVLCRTVTLPAGPLLLLLGHCALRRHGVLAGRARTVLCLCSVSFLLVATLPGVRNLLATGTPIFLPQSGSYNLLLRNPPPADLDPAALSQSLLCRIPRLSASSCTLLGYALTRPARFFGGLLKKGLFTLGLRREASLPAPFYPMPACFALLWIALLHFLASGGLKKVPGGAVLLTFAAVQLAVMPFFAPTHQYGNRLMLPLYLALFPFGGRLLRLLLVSWPGPFTPQFASKNCPPDRTTPLLSQSRSRDCELS